MSDLSLSIKAAKSLLANAQEQLPRCDYYKILDALEDEVIERFGAFLPVSADDIERARLRDPLAEDANVLLAPDPLDPNEVARP